MYHSNDSLTGSPTFTVRTKKLTDGRFEADVPSIPDLKPVIGSDEIDAIRSMQQEISAWLLTGAPKHKA